MGTFDSMVRDSLHNASLDCTNTNIGDTETAKGKNLAQLYASGIVVGVVSSLMAQYSVPFQVAIKMLYQMVKDDRFDTNCLPECWKEDYAQAKIEIDRRVPSRSII